MSPDSKAGRFFDFVGRVTPLAVTAWMLILGTLLAWYFVTHQQFGWAFGSFFVLVAVLFVGSLIRPLGASSFELAIGLFKLLVQIDPHERVEALVQERLKSLPADTRLEEMKPAIAEAISEATRKTFKEFASKIETIVSEARSQRGYGIADFISRPQGFADLKVDVRPTGLYGLAGDRVFKLEETDLRFPTIEGKPLIQFMTDVSGKQAKKEEGKGKEGS